MLSKEVAISQRPDYTFKYNQKLGRHGWLRLTPAYSVKLVSEIIANLPSDSIILEPFSGTATTGLVAAENKLYSHCFDINPFLIWLGNSKCKNYSKDELSRLKQKVDVILTNCESSIEEDNWLPEIFNITRWWREDTLKVLSALRQELVNHFGEPQSKVQENISALAWIAFCRLVVETSSAAFNHVSMSFKSEVPTYKLAQIKAIYLEIIERMVDSASQPLLETTKVYYGDSRQISSIDDTKYSHAITSPPYANRVSYIRELRPYMYWTKFLNNSHDAGELDWQAIGGTWGTATSKLKNWIPQNITIPASLNSVVSEISALDEKNALLMANYVCKYFCDMHLHFTSLAQHLKKGAMLHYIVGNSTFYGVKVNTQNLLAASLDRLGYSNIDIKIVRKRNSKKELYEYCVSGTWEGNK